MHLTVCAVAASIRLQILGIHERTSIVCPHLGLYDADWKRFA